MRSCSYQLLNLGNGKQAVNMLQSHGKVRLLRLSKPLKLGASICFQKPSFPSCAHANCLAVYRMIINHIELLPPVGSLFLFQFCRNSQVSVLLIEDNTPGVVQSRTCFPFQEARLVSFLFDNLTCDQPHTTTEASSIWFALSRFREPVVIIISSHVMSFTWCLCMSCFYWFV